MNFKGCVRKVIQQLRQVSTAQQAEQNNRLTSKKSTSDQQMASGFTKDFQVRLEWARRKIANFVTEINTTQIVLEEIHCRVQKQLSIMRSFEELVTAKSIYRKRRNVSDSFTAKVLDQMVLLTGYPICVCVKSYIFC